MFQQQSLLLLGVVILIGAGESARAQCPGGGMMGLNGGMMGPGGGMMGMKGGMKDIGGGTMGVRRDSATMAQMATTHYLVVNHDRIARTVTNLPDGIRTTTESDDPQVAQRIREHVAVMYARVLAGDDPGLPIESAALRALYRNGDRISTVVDTTSRGIVVVQTSRDPETVVALQKHASEVTELVRDGMAAMHRAMMSNGPAMMGRGMTGVKRGA